MRERHASLTTVAARPDGVTRVSAHAPIVRRVVTALCLFLVMAVVGVLGGVGWIGSERAIHPAQTAHGNGRYTPRGTAATE